MSHRPARTCLVPESGRQAMYSPLKLAMHTIQLLFVEQSIFYIHCMFHLSRQIICACTLLRSVEVNQKTDWFCMQLPTRAPQFDLDGFYICFVC